MIWNITILGLFFGAIAVRAWLGFLHGSVAETRQVLTQLFAILVAFRYWQVCTGLFAGLVSFDPRYVACMVLIGLYAISAVIAGLCFQIKAPIFESVGNDYFGKPLGALAGVFSGSLIGGILVSVLLLLVPVAEHGDISVPEMVQCWPSHLAKEMEINVARVSPEETQIRYPAVVEAEKTKENENGKVELVWK